MYISVADLKSDKKLLIIEIKYNYFKLKKKNTKYDWMLM